MRARYIIVTNAAALLGTLFTLGYLPATLLQPSWLLPLAQALYAPVYLGAIALNHARRYFAATLWLSLSCVLLSVAQVFISGAELRIQGFLLLAAILPFLLFRPNEERPMFAVAAFGLLLFVLIEIFGAALPRLGPAPSPQLLRIILPFMNFGLYVAVAACAYYARKSSLAAEAESAREHQRSEDLLLNILPSPIAERLKRQPATIADAFAEVTVLFADIVGFTSLSAKLPPARLVDVLNELFSRFDDLAARLSLEKIKTIGDAYMVAGGLPSHSEHHAEAVADMALGMLAVVAEFSRSTGQTLDIRIGINTGPVVAGVIGKKKFIYDLWGDTVNTASRMESHGLPGCIQVTEPTFRLLEGKFHLRPRGEIDVKGKGPLRTWFLDGKKNS